MAFSLQPVELQTLTKQAMLHCHDHHQIVIGLEGYIDFVIDGISNRVSRGQGVMVTSGKGHTFRGTGKNQILVLNLPAHNYFFSMEVHQRILPLLSKPGYFQLDQSAQQLILNLVKEISQYPGDKLLKRSCGDILLCLLEKHFLPVYQSNSSTAPRNFNLELLDQYIISRLDGPISVAQLASRVFLGESQFYARFKRQTGQTPSRYVTQLRVKQAQKLLEHTQMSIEGITQSCGFSSQSSFSHVFRRLTGFSPARYRNTHTSSQ
ncbi:AraC family transcriptional regulator [Celerinatantimonas diazotrophica]|uniref:AraC family transcriptional regulator n=1 Tax=Celerinatantimonas diazotrophica TaxID=412034 RepID=A0A4R1J7T5_9GAMM|nr:AraC family transcriptional regulator [Celerinatantimonas diazotrophica]TCK46486.1 AraC family transcriptional regulator [Celerinatantimonas diazotrophica]CAG9296536.1 HTH-type transcriptional activator RhaS [Celerinatantimonas diazotrophica]